MKSKKGDRGHGGNLRKKSSQYGIDTNDIIDFSSNINPLGFPKVLEKAFNSSLNDIMRYPDPDSTGLVGSIGRYLGISRKKILCGNGSDELFFCLFAAMRPKKVIIVSPTYSEYELAASANACSVGFFYLERKNRFRIDTERLLGSIKSDIDILVLCNPNNPTGTTVAAEDIRKIYRRCRQKDVLLLVDEAFMDFTYGKDSIAADAVSSGSLVVSRSLTKIFSIPGLRLGYFVGDEGLLGIIKRHQQSWPVNSVAQSVGIQILSDRQFIEESRKYIKKEKDSLYDRLGSIEHLEVFEPSVNFILCRIIKSPLRSKDIAERMAKECNILIRDCSNFRGLDDSYFRVAVRSRQENALLIDCLKKIGLD